MDRQQYPSSSPTAFFVLAFVLSTPLYVLNLLAFWSVLGAPEIGPVYIVLLTFTPGLAAVLLTAKSHGKEAVKTLLLRVLDFHRIKQKGWYIPVFLLGPLILILSFGLIRFMGAPAHSPLAPVIAFPAVFALCLLLAAGEEAGWMGYAAKPMQERNGALRAALILGVIWAAWHAPFFVFLFPDPIACSAQLLTLVGTRILLFWVFNNTGGSVFAVTLYHAADNTALLLLPDFKGTVPLGPLVQCGLTLFAALLVALLCDSSTMTRLRFGARARPSID